MSKLNPMSSRMFRQALSFHRKGRAPEAEHLCLLVIGAEPNHFEARHLLALLRLQQEKYSEAFDLLAPLSRAQPHKPKVWSNLGLVLQKLKRYEEALDAFERVLAVKSNDAVTLHNKGTVLDQLGRCEEAITNFDLALMKRPAHAETHYCRGNAAKNLGRHQDAIASYSRALRLKPSHVEALHSRAYMLAQLGHYEQAIADYDRLLTIGGSAQAELHFNRALALQLSVRHEEALAGYDKAISARPNYAEAFYNRASMLAELNRHEEALESYDRALALRPDYIRALINRGNTLQRLRRHTEAVAGYDAALAINPDNAEALYNSGNALFESQCHAEALASYDRALQLAPDHPHALTGLANCALAICDWRRTTELATQLENRILTNQGVINPFTFLGYCDNPEMQYQCAKAFIQSRVPQPKSLLWSGEVWKHDRIRIAYLSSDFREHATAFLAIELFEHHDRTRFEVLGISYGHDDKSEMRARLVAAFDRFHDVASKSDSDVAQLLRDLQVDIAIDLKGITYSSRPSILAHRPAPIQVNYLGYPGTTGAEFIDYIIADQFVLPFAQQQYYTEKIVHLPNCYQVNSQRQMTVSTLTRAEAGLPETGFVFCCFNNNYKIMPQVFDIWIRLLAALDGSVLWLLRDNKGAEANLRNEAQSRGIDPNRLVFADRVNLDEHLARHRLADLFLDTLPINAHTTASDALWAGLPVLTCLGRVFAGRVAASLVNAAGLPELITNSLEDYEKLAMRVAREPRLLARFKERLAQSMQTNPLFESRQYCRQIEAAYTMMFDLWQHGDSPQALTVRSAFPIS
jgi:protein O-GlcNAc transferase